MIQWHTTRYFSIILSTIKNKVNYKVIMKVNTRTFYSHQLTLNSPIFFQRAS